MPNLTFLPFYPGVCSEVQNLGSRWLILPFYLFAFSPGDLIWGPESGLEMANFTFYLFTGGSGLIPRIWARDGKFYHFTRGGLTWGPESGLDMPNFTLLPFYLGVLSKAQNLGLRRQNFLPGGLLWCPESGLDMANFTFLPFYLFTRGSA